MEAEHPGGFADASAAGDAVTVPPSAGAQRRRVEPYVPTLWKPKNPLARAYVAAVKKLDATLRRRANIIEFTDDPQSILRMEVRQAGRPLTFADGTRVNADERIVEVHLWSENVAQQPAGRASFGWARWMRNAWVDSLRQLSVYLDGRPDLADIKAIRANFNFGKPKKSRELDLFAAGFDFEHLRDPRHGTGHFLHLFGDNIFLAMMLLAFNPATFRWGALIRGRSDSFITRATLRSRYGTRKPLR